MVSPQGLTYHLKHWFINSIHKVSFSSIKLFFAVSMEFTFITCQLVGFLLCTTCSCALWYIKCTINTLCCMILYRFTVGCKCLAVNLTLPISIFKHVYHCKCQHYETPWEVFRDVGKYKMRKNQGLLSAIQMGMRWWFIIYIHIEQT